MNQYNRHRRANVMSTQQICFICDHEPWMGRLAGALARRRMPDRIDFTIVGSGDETSSPHDVDALLTESGLDVSGLTVTPMESIVGKQFDLVVLINDSSENEAFHFPGAPHVLKWNFEIDGNRSREHYREQFNRLQSRVEELFSVGYFDAFVSHREYTERLVESLSEGILAHDMSRRVFYFSRGAEKLTGLKAAEVLGKDCHELFEPRLCGPECSFCDADNCDGISAKSYPTVFLRPDGTRQEFRVSVSPLRGRDNKTTGVVASLSDLTRLHSLERELEQRSEFWGIIGQDAKMQGIYDMITDLGQCDFPVVITGESGTGKELVAQAIHKESTRRSELFVPINCGALPEGTLESELFGHVRGSFTGAIRDKKGRFELADNGTIFLDEVGELPQHTQVKLLRVIQEGTFEPVGGEKTKKVNVRVISATNKDLKEMVGNGTFREDLFYRLAVVPVMMPPLRERKNDIPILAEHFLKVVSKRLGRPGMTLAPETVSVLISYHWPGNIRQLQNAIQYSMVKCHEQTVQPEHLPPEITGTPFGQVTVPPVIPVEPGKAGRKPKLSPGVVELALKRAAGNKAKAARILGVGRATLYNFLSLHPDLAEAGEVE